MAPEQRANAQGVDHRADIYSLGVVFYEMLTGEIPMGRFEAPSKRVQVDVRLDEVVLRALEREPARRYQQASEVKTDVESFAESGPVKPAVNKSEGFPTEWPIEVVKILAIAAVIAVTMGTLGSGWPLVLLLVGNVMPNRTAGPKEKRWVKAVWAVCVVGLSGYGVWITKSGWPLIALWALTNWGEEEEETEENEASDGDLETHPSDPPLKEADASGVSAALPFVVQKRVRGPFGRVSGLMRLDEHALALEFEVKSVISRLRTAPREVRIPYAEVALADLDFLDRLVLRTTRLGSMADVPTNDKGELTLTISKPFDDMSKRAAKRFVAALNYKIAGRAPGGQG